MLYSLFHQVYKESCCYNELPLLENKFISHVINKKNVVLLEYGCATAPITKSYLEFFESSQNNLIYISDIKYLSFHYAMYRYGKYKNVIPVLLEKKDNFLPTYDRKIDIIFCMTVLEHLPEPLKIIKIFYDILAPSGILVFDYIKGDGKGLDTDAGVKERKDVLRFIEDNFDILEGKILYDESMGNTIIRKK